jgi:hypothetical protein
VPLSRRIAVAASLSVLISAGCGPETEPPPSPGQVGGGTALGPLPPVGGSDPDVILASDQPDPESPEQAGFRSIGAVLLEVNGRAIFADDILDARRNQLRGLARRLPPSTFEREAAAVLMQELRERVGDLLRRSLHERLTDGREREMARNMTTIWRTRFITEHGGSEARARQAAREQWGRSLEQVVEDQYAFRLAEIFVSQRILPASQPSADDVRVEYRRLKDAGLLTVPGRIEFRLIEIRPDSIDPTALVAARVRARELLDRATAGEDFGRLARDHSDNPGYAARQGRLPEALLPLQRGAYVLTEVESAAWETQVGDVVPEVVEVPTDSVPRLFIIRVDAKQQEEVLSFDDVQARLLADLRSRNRDRIEQRLLAQESERAQIPEPDEQSRAMRMLLEITRQNYAAWRDAG